MRILITLCVLSPFLVAGCHCGAGSLSNANLDDADLRSRLTGQVVIVDSSLDRANLSGRAFRQLLIEGSSLRGAALSDIQLSEGLGLMRVELSGARLRNITAEDGAIIEGRGSDVDFSGARLGQGQIRGAFPAASFRDAALRGMTLDGSFPNADFSEASLESFGMDGEFTSTRFVSATLRVGELRGMFTGANFEEARLVQVHLDGDFRDSHFVGATLGAHELRGDFRGANFERADLTGSQEIEARLEGANLEGTVLRGVDLSFSSFGAGVRGRPVCDRWTRWPSDHPPLECQDPE